MHLLGYLRRWFVRVAQFYFYAGENCANLANVNIGKSVTTIGHNAFEGSYITTIVSQIENLFDIYDWQSDYRVFSIDTYTKGILYVPVGRSAEYKLFNGWKDFVNIKEGIPSDVSKPHRIKEKDVMQYNLNGAVIQSPQKGINIIKMDNGSTKKIFVK